ncbi:MAG: hypothetical protein ACR2NG_03040 [Acidimicrobiia bacterium]
MRLVLDARTAAFGGLIDYAGLFPPASNTMDEAVAEYARLRADDSRWIVGKFLCRASELEQLAAAAVGQMRRGDAPWDVGVIFDMGPGAAAMVVNDFQTEMSPALSITSVEVKTPRPDADAIATTIEAMGALDTDTAVFVEVVKGEPMRPQVEAIATNLRSRGRTGGAKLRCGGLSPEDFPTVEEIAEFLWTSTNEQLPFKATAGLHQPIRHFDEDAGVWRHGFVNLLMASVSCDDGAIKETVEAIVAESDPEEFAVSASAARWQKIRLPGSAIRRSRRNGFIAFGSCDIDEPITALRDLNFLGEGT